MCGYILDYWVGFFNQEFAILFKVTLIDRGEHVVRKFIRHGYS